jgi:DNA mismatch repair protein MutS2
MAGRLGLNASIIDAARRNLSEREARLAEHLAKVDADLRALEHERRLVKREREALGEADQRARSREESLRHREESLKQKLNEKLDERLREARAEIDAVMADLRRHAAALTEQAERRPDVSLSTGDTGRLRAEARAAVESVVDRLRGSDAGTQPAPPSVPSRTAVVGDRVAIRSLGLEGTVVLVHNQEAEVEVRGKRFRAQTGELRVLEAPAGKEPPPAQVRVNVQLQPREGSLSELLLVGNTVDEAISRVEKFLDENLLTEQRTVRIIHGYGTGQLRKAIGEFLRVHPLVASVRSATPEQGGGGVTIVELKD